jgi:hypothetical protein
MTAIGPDEGNRELRMGDVMLTEPNKMYGPHVAGPEGFTAVWTGASYAAKVVDHTLSKIETTDFEAWVQICLSAAAGGGGRTALNPAVAVDRREWLGPRGRPKPATGRWCRSRRPGPEVALAPATRGSTHAGHPSGVLAPAVRPA